MYQVFHQFVSKHYFDTLFPKPQGGDTGILSLTLGFTLSEVTACARKVLSWTTDSYLSRTNLQCAKRADLCVPKQAVWSIVYKSPPLFLSPT